MAACTEEVGDDSNGDYCYQDYHKSSATGNVGLSKLENSEMLKKADSIENTVTANKTQDLNNLSEDDFRKLLEEAATFNRPSNSESTLLQQLRREVAESDLCEDVSQQNDAELNIASGVPSKISRNPVHGNQGNRYDYHCSDVNLFNDFNGSAGEEESGDASLLETGPSMHHAQDCRLRDVVTLQGDSISLHNHKSKCSCHSQAVSICDPCSDESKMPVTSCSQPLSKIKSNSCASQNGNSAAVTKGPVKNVCVRNVLDDLGETASSKCSCSSRDGSKHGDCQNAKAICDTFSKLDCVDQNTDSNATAKSKVMSNAGVAAPLTSVVEIEMVEIKEQKKRAEIVDESVVCLKKHHKLYQNCNENEHSRFYQGNCTSIAVDEALEFPLKSINASERKEAIQNRKIGSDSSGIHCRVSQDQHYVIQSDQCKSGQMVLEPAVNVSQGIISGKTYDSRIHAGLDMNGNQIICAMPSISHTMFSDSFFLSSVKSSAYENHASKLEIGTVRKTKKSRANNSDDVILAENISGHRGNEGIDSLLDFINSTDKKTKNNASVGNCSLSSMNTQMNKAILVQDVLVKKDKVSSKDAKPKNQKARSHVKKKSTSSSGLMSEDSGVVDENYDDSNSQDDNDTVHSNSNSVEHDTLQRNNSPSGVKDSNVLREGTSDGAEHTSGSPSSFQSSPDSLLSNETNTSSFVSDFYAVTDMGQVFEESEFQVVINKHRKRRQSKKSESFRHCGGSVSRHSLNGGSRAEGIMLLSSLPIAHRSQRNKIESVRRKSTSSMPPSEHSSADNSDVDSVHSLPVGGSAPVPSYPHSHTTPSSTSLTPQTSYADIARMSRSRTGFCLNANSLPVGLSKNLPPELQEGEIQDAVQETTSCESKSTSTEVTQKCQSSVELQENSASNPQTVQENPPENTVPTLDEMRHTVSDTVEPLCTGKLTKESITQTDPVIVDSIADSCCDSKHPSTSCLDEAEAPADKDEPSSHSDVCSDNDPALLPTNEKPREVQPEKFSLCKYQRPAVILMENCLPPEDMSGVTFGFEVNEELIKMTASCGDNDDEAVKRASVVSVSSSPPLAISVTFTGGDSSSKKDSAVTERASPAADHTVPVFKHYNCAKDFPVDQKQQRPHCSPQQKAVFRKDGELVVPFNYSQIVNFIGLAWEDSVRDCRIDEHEGRQNRGRRAKYYSD